MPTQEDTEVNALNSKLVAQKLGMVRDDDDVDRAAIEDMRKQAEELLHETVRGKISNNGYIEQLKQLFFGATWDGHLIGKSHRDELVKAGLAERAKGGYNIITKKGVEYLVDLGLVHPK